MDRRSRSSLRLEILGPLRIWRDGVEIDPGPPQQAGLLATLLASADQQVSTNELISMVWDGDSPATAVNIVHKYVGALRRLLEPSLPSRTGGSYLRRSEAGYLFDPGSGTLDVVEFRRLVAAARRSADGPALDHYTAALRLWRGHAGDGLGPTEAARTLFAALDNEFFEACIAATHLAVSDGQTEGLLAPLRLAAAMAPFHEPLHACLIVTLAGAGRQAEALSIFGTFRARLAEELGADPGPTVLDAYRQVLRPRGNDGPGGHANAARKAAGRGSASSGGLVGRSYELGIVGQAVAAAMSGDTGLVLVEGEPGIGKTRLLDQAAAAARPGALVVWGRCLEGDGTPAMWPWTQIVGGLLESVTAPVRRRSVAGELGRLVRSGRDGPDRPGMPDSGAPFRLFEEVTALIGEVAARRPTVLVVDDLQWADGSSLRLLSHLTARLPRGAALIGALRNRAPVPGSELTKFLATAGRMPAHRRVRLAALAPSEVGELVQGQIGRDPGASVAQRIHARTGGNPFFVRELSRLLAGDEGAITAAAVERVEVPATVRDVVRDRTARLGPETLAVLQIAAVIGREVEVRLLARAAGLPTRACVQLLDPLDALGLLTSPPGDPFSLRFPHDLIRESVVAVTPASAAPRLHLRVADALEHLTPDPGIVAERLAHHLWTAGPLADPARTTAALIRAGRSAAAKSALDVAERQLRSAAAVARSAGLAEPELSALKQLAAVVGMRSLYGGAAALDLLERAEHLARRLGQEREAADFLFSRWAGHAQAIELDRGAPLARLLFEQGEASADPTVRAYGLNAWGIHQWDIGNVGEGVRLLRRAAEVLHGHAARRDDDPLRHDLQMLPAAIFAEMTAQHGDLDTAQALLDELEELTGDDPYMITVWASMAARTAANIGDAPAALRLAERGIAVDPGFTFVFQGTYLRLARLWALAMTGQDPAGAADRAERLIRSHLLDSPRSCVATWFGLLGEARLAAGQLDEAAAALDCAQRALDTFGQRYPEGLILLIRAKMLRASGASAGVVEAAAERAYSLSVTREAHLYAARAARMLRESAHRPT
jgi:DNA-binding SARP family transcriptional activator